MPHLFRAVLCLSLAVFAGCSSYDQRFTAVSQIEGPLKTGPYAGAYAGRWTSASHPGSGGDLRCILSPISASDYRAEFHATWHGLSSTHSVVLHTVPAGRKRASLAPRDFEGTSRLQTIIGAGTYRCKGRMADRTIQASYDATYDRGTFEMKRVTAKAVAR